jgi:hypothetical protein
VRLGWRALQLMHRVVRRQGEHPMSIIRHSLVLAASCLVIAAGAVAQTPASRPDSAPNDTIRSADAWLIVPGLAGLAAALAIAPPALLTLPLTTPPDSLGGLRPMLVSLFGVAGIADAESHDRMAYSAGVQVIAGHVFADVRGEGLHTSSRTRFVSGAVGYLVRPAKQLAGGVAVGYRRSELPVSRGALQIALPLFFGNERATVLFEPTYLIGEFGVDWTWRGQFEFYVLPRPFFAGVLFEVQPLAHGHSIMTGLLFGVRH